VLRAASAATTAAKRMMVSGCGGEETLLSGVPLNMQLYMSIATILDHAARATRSFPQVLIERRTDHS
jgi:hypothetical protein